MDDTTREMLRAVREASDKTNEAPGGNPEPHATPEGDESRTTERSSEAPHLHTSELSIHAEATYDEDGVLVVDVTSLPGLQCRYEVAAWCACGAVSLGNGQWIEPATVTSPHHVRARRRTVTREVTAHAWEVFCDHEARFGKGSDSSCDYEGIACVGSLADALWCRRCGAMSNDGAKTWQLPSAR
jgi:hypothetical protein